MGSIVSFIDTVLSYTCKVIAITVFVDGCSSPIAGGGDTVGFVGSPFTNFSLQFLGAVGQLRR